MRAAFASFLLWTGAVALLGFVALLCAIAAHAADIPVTVCADVPLPGADRVLNPHDPPERQVRETMRACEVVPVPGRDITRTKPVIYQPKDPRNFA